MFLKNVLASVILDFTLFPEESEFYSCFRIMEEKRLEYEAREKAIFFNRRKSS